MGIWYLILMGLVCLLAIYETISFYREYSKSGGRKYLTRFGIKVIVLIILIILFVWTINAIIEITPS
ncbi:MAG: hypothetical protein QME40_02160 [bacterium]|nr:hypothetical protein [bacterium]